MNSNGIVDLPCQSPVAETADRVEQLLRAKGMKIFLRLDQAEEAKAAGLTMRPMILIIFGDPKADEPVSFSCHRSTNQGADPGIGGGQSLAKLQ
jgi:hypothetical protein